jgi:hypothetical protein
MRAAGVFLASMVMVETLAACSYSPAGTAMGEPNVSGASAAEMMLGSSIIAAPLFDRAYSVPYYTPTGVAAYAKVLVLAFDRGSLEGTAIRAILCVHDRALAEELAFHCYH